MNIRKKLIIAAMAGLLAFTGCSVDQTKEAKLPDVDVSAESGNLPKYEVTKTEDGKMPNVDVQAEGGQMPEVDVDTADVDVSTEKETVKVPKAKVVVEEETVEVPDVDVTMPNENKDS